MRQILLMILIPLFLLSCNQTNNSQEGHNVDKTHLRDLQWYKKGDVRLVYKNEVLFTGSAWSSDDSFLEIVCSNGNVKQANIYNENGTISLVVDFRPGQDVINESTDISYILYNNEGKPLRRVAKNQEPSNAKYRAENVDPTSASYGNHQGEYIYGSLDDTYPYSQFGYESKLKRAEAIMDLEFKQIKQ